MDLSVIVPVYNTAVYLRECLDSIFGQKVEDCSFEVICVDDGSTDASHDILMEYSNIYPNLQVIFQNNSGPSVSRNSGISRAKGDYILFVDSDDILCAGAFAVIQDNILRYSADIFSFNVDSVFNDNGLVKSVFEYYRPKKEYWGNFAGRDLFAERVNNGDQIDSVWLFCIKRSWLRDGNISFYPGALYEDSMFCLDCYFSCDNMVHINDGLYRYRVRENSIMTSAPKAFNVKWRLVQLNKCLSYLLNNDFSDNVKQALIQYTKKTISDVKSTYYVIDEAERKLLSEMDSVNSLLAFALNLNESNLYNSKLIIQGFLAAVNAYDKIILYGAGKIGTKVSNYLRQQNLCDKIIGYAVSSSEPERFIDNFPVRCIKEYVPAEDVLVIICTMENYHKIMYDNASSAGFRNIIVIDFIIESEINKFKY